MNFQEMLRDTGADTPHVCTADSCPEPSSYYVSAVDDAGQGYYLMAGPYATHSAALADVGLAQLIASRYGSDGSKGDWMRWGTLRYPDGNTEQGRLNKSTACLRVTQQTNWNGNANAKQGRRVSLRKQPRNSC